MATFGNYQVDAFNSQIEITTLQGLATAPRTASYMLARPLQITVDAICQFRLATVPTEFMDLLSWHLWREYWSHKSACYAAYLHLKQESMCSASLNFFFPFLMNNSQSNIPTRATSVI